MSRMDGKKTQNAHITIGGLTGVVLANYGVDIESDQASAEEFCENLEREEEPALVDLRCSKNRSKRLSYSRSGNFQRHKRRSPR